MQPACQTVFGEYQPQASCEERERKKNSKERKKGREIPQSPDQVILEGSVHGEISAVNACRSFRLPNEAKPSREYPGRLTSMHRASWYVV